VAVYLTTYTAFGVVVCARSIDGRGMATVNDGSGPDGFWEPAWYSMDEIDNRQLSCVLPIRCQQLLINRFRVAHRPPRQLLRHVG
jgi:hypothetical protein